MRHPSQPLGCVYVVSAEGRIRTLPMGTGITCAVLDSKGRVTEAYAERGWITLEQAYRDEGRPDLFATWLEAQRARQRGAQATIPDEGLPRIVIERRAAQPKWSPIQMTPRRGRGSK